jgi:hypothetical protein
MNTKVTLLACIENSNGLQGFLLSKGTYTTFAFPDATSTALRGSMTKVESWDSTTTSRDSYTALSHVSEDKLELIGEINYHTTKSFDARAEMRYFAARGFPVDQTRKSERF